MSSTNTPAPGFLLRSARRSRRSTVGRLALGLVVVASFATGLEAQRTRRSGTNAPMMRVSTTPGGEANAPTDVVAISATGRFVAYSSVASNLAPDDAVGWRDVFVFDRRTGTTDLVSVSVSGQPGNGASGAELAISANGRFVAFDSWADDLVVGDDNDQLDVFVRDRQQGTTERVSVSSTGAQANGPSSGLSMSADGCWVAFASWADNLVGHDTEGVQDVFLRDRVAGITRRVSETPTGVGGEAGSHSPSISANGLHVAYSTRANNLVPHEPLGPYHYIFVFDVLAGETWHASKNSDGQHAEGECDTRPAISADGRFVTFSSYAYNLVMPDLNGMNDVFVHDRVTGDTVRISDGPFGQGGNGGSVLPTISADARFVAFMSSSDNLVPGDRNRNTDIFLFDRATNTTHRLTNGPTNGSSTMPQLSSSGAYVVFGSEASNLVLGDTNGMRDAFLCTTP